MKIAIITRPTMVGFNQGGFNKRMYHLANGLVERGHQVKLFAMKGSKTKATLMDNIKFSPPLPRAITWEERLYFISEAIKQSQDCDIINCQTDHMATFFDAHSKVPIIHTLITSSFYFSAVDLLKYYKNLDYSAVSKAAKSNYLGFLNFRGTVYNGCDVESFKFNDEPSDYFLSLSRIDRQKANHRAIDAAKKAGVKLKIAGKILDEDYFEKEIKPRLDKNITYLGEIKPEAFDEKVKLIQNAKATLVFSAHDEGFSNTILESLSCGTPVIAWNQTSYKEIIKNDYNGYIVDSLAEAKKAIKKIEAIKRKNCRETVLKKYTYDHMVEGYEKLFKKIIKEKRKVN